MKRIAYTLIAATLMVCSCESPDWINTDAVSYDVESISLSKHEIKDMIVGETKQLRASFTPAEASQKDVQWVVSSEAVLTVNESGLIKATGLGEGYVVAVSKAVPSKTDTCYVSVTGAAGIKVCDVLTDETVTDDILFIRNSTGERSYKVFVAVHNSYDTDIEMASSDPEVAQIVEKTIDGEKAFTIVPGQKLGKTIISIQSKANEDVKKSFSVTLETVAVTSIALSFNQDGTQSAKAIATDLTVGRSQNVRVVFTTDKEGISVPENSGISLSSDNTAVATVASKGTYDPATQTVSFTINMVDNPGNAPDGKAVITATSDDGSFTATATVTAKCPPVQKVTISKTVSEPIHAGDTYQLSCNTVPEDAYDQSVIWTSADESVATVDANGLVTVNKDFIFDAANPEATEIKIKVTAKSNSEAFAECTIKPYQYVPATGVMVTDQWGNRLRGTGITTSKVSGNNNVSNASIQYCAGSGSNKKTNIGELYSWAVASPAVEGVTKVGSIAVYLTATPYPYTYPTIADPDQPFYWASYSNSRFPIAGEGYEDGSTLLGWTGYSKDDGKARLFLGHTCKFFTAHSSSTDDVLYVRVYRYDEGKENSANVSKTMLFRTAVHTIYKDNSKYGNPLVKNSDGTVPVFTILNKTGIPNPFDDPCPEKWAGPMPTPGVYYKLDDAGAPVSPASWGTIPVPTTLAEYPNK